MKRAVFALALILACPALADEPPAFTLTPQQAQDYANRLQAEMRQLETQYTSDKAILDALMQQGKPKESAPDKEPN